MSDMWRRKQSEEEEEEEGGGGVILCPSPTAEMHWYHANRVRACDEAAGKQHGHTWYKSEGRVVSQADVK